MAPLSGRYRACKAHYFDPINTLFGRISSQPQYAFGAGYTHVFSQNLVNYFNPGFSWYASLFGPSNYAQTIGAFPIVLQGQGANAPFSSIGGQDNTWIQGRRATRFFINDNLSWTHGAHELRFGLNARIFRLNDYDFGEGNVPTVTYTTLSAIHPRSSPRPPPRPFPSLPTNPSRTFSISTSMRKTPGR